MTRFKEQTRVELSSVLNPLLVTVYSAHTNGRTLPPLFNASSSRKCQCLVAEPQFGQERQAGPYRRDP